MLISRQHEAVVLNLKRPERVTTVIPSARKITLAGLNAIVVPHRPDETRVLRNLGFDVASPILCHYDWPGQLVPKQAHKEAADFTTRFNRGFNVSGMGVGKTITTLWAYDYLRRTKTVRRMLVVAPLSTLDPTWGNHIFMNFPHLDFAVLHGSADKRLKLLAQDVDIYIINHHGLKIRALVDALAKRPDIDIVVIDEVATFRNSGTGLWKAANTICNNQTRRRVWGLTGTPTPNEPTDAWAQCKLVMPHSMPYSFRRFRDLVMRQISQYVWEAREDAADTVFKFMQPAIRFELDDLGELPPQIYIDRDVPLTDDQQRVYDDMMRRLHAEYNGGQINAVNEAVKASKLLQVAAGCAYGETGEIQLPVEPRIKVLCEVIEEAVGKVIVFVPFTAALHYVAAELEKRKYSVAKVYGDVSKNERDNIFKNFQNSKHPRVIVADAKTMSHGLTLLAASAVVWFTPITSNDIFGQANARIHRLGKVNTSLVIQLSGSSIERRMYRRLQKKQKLQGILLDLLKENTQEERYET
jgi:SNF2 family DNA or RNA helicase